MCLGYLTLFTSGGGFGSGGSFGATRCFNPFSGGGACCLFSLTEILLQGNRRGRTLLRACGVCGLACCCLGGLCSGLSFGLGEQGLLTNLFGGAVTQLRAILSSRGGEVAILRSVQVSPRVKYSDIFRRLGDAEIIDLVRAPFFHRLLSCPGVLAPHRLRRGGWSSLADTLHLLSCNR
jgi:hypothetical protein